MIRVVRSALIALALVWITLSTTLPTDAPWLPIDPTSAVIVVAICMGCAMSSHVTAAIGLGVHQMLFGSSPWVYRTYRALPTVLTSVAALTLVGILQQGA